MRFHTSVVFLAGAALLQSACSASYAMIAKRNLDVQTRMSDTIFLDPVIPAQRTIWVEVKNTSDKPDLDLQAAVTQQIAAKGYRVVDDPRLARFILQANLLSAGRTSRTAIEQAGSSAYGSTLLAGAVGGGTGYAAGRAGGGSPWGLAASGALVGATAETVSGAFVQDVSYAIITDVQVQERGSGAVINETHTADLAQGSSGRRSQSSAQTTDRARYRTRVVAYANKVNLDWPEASPEIAAGLSRVIAGIF